MNVVAEVPDRVSDPTLAELLRRLVPAYPPERVYLFGSRARGETGPDGDYDILLVVPDDAPPERRRARLAYEVLRGTGVAADVLVWTGRAGPSRSDSAWSRPCLQRSSVKGGSSLASDAAVCVAREFIARVPAAARP